MIALKRVAAFGSRSTISGWAAISPSPKSSRFARHRVRRRLDYPAPLGLDLIGTDNWPLEVLPTPDTQLSAPVYQILLVINGIHMLENMKLEELAAKRVHEFAFMMQPLKMQGFSGSTVAPIAVR